MKRIFSLFSYKNIQTGYLYFYIHFVMEVLCFYVLGSLVRDSIILWFIPFIYDAIAFVPQALIGYIKDKIPKLKIDIIGLILLIIGFLLFNLKFNVYISVIILCLGNALIHVSGAFVTLKSSCGKLSHSAIYVSGGSFGVVTGRLLAKTCVPYYFLIILALTMIPYMLLANKYLEDDNCSNFNYQNQKLNPMLVVMLTVFIVIVRGYMGYGIPTTWNKTMLQTVFLYVAMGLGKAFGGILADKIGIKKVLLISIIGSLPFLLFGDNNMYISLIGISIFSMTMSITLGILVSCLKKTPSLAFGLTTIGLFLGTIPIFFFKFTTVLANCILITILDIICLVISMLVIRKENKYE